MSSAKGRILRLLENFVLREARVIAKRVVGPFVELTVDSLGDAQPGDKIQILLPDNDVRTYTPIPGDPPTLLIHLHADTPGPRWARGVAPGDTFRFKGPDRSLRLPDGPVVIVGDATSVAVAKAFALARPGSVTALIEGPFAPEGMRTFATGDYAAIAAAVPDGATVALTGGSALVVAVRAALRARSIDAVTKAYWAPGRTGID
jgi:NADPH-dependent ferric siderophore reductase